MLETLWPSYVSRRMLIWLTYREEGTDIEMKISKASKTENKKKKIYLQQYYFMCKLKLEGRKYNTEAVHSI